MILLLPHPVSKLSLFRSLLVCHRSILLTGEGGMGWGRSQMTRWRESLVLYKSLTTLRLTSYLTLLGTGKAEKDFGLFTF